MSISCRQRFEVFKRDSFICQYCGRKPPDVILHADHILAVSKGGLSVMENLLTSCRDCNLGKSNIPVDKTVGPLNLSVEDRRERLDQLKAYEDFMQDERLTTERWVDELLEFWAKLEGQTDPDKYRYDVEIQSSIRRFLKHLPKSDIQECIQIAFDRFPADTWGEWQRDRYFFGVCWRKIKGDRPHSEAKKCT